jgi:formylglycine-generating enzyme required for sulfatase activity
LAPAIPRAPFVAAQKARKTDVYLAPEFLAGHPIDSRADVYSMGVILGEMVSGALPIAGRVPDLRTSNPDLPPAVEALYRRCLAANAESRYPSASELAAELLALAETTAPPLPRSLPPSAASAPPPSKSLPPVPPGVAVAKSLPPGAAGAVPPVKPKVRPPPPPEQSDNFEVKTDVDEKFEPPESEPKAPATVIERGTRPSRIAKPLPPSREPGSIPIEPPATRRPKPPPAPPPPVAERGGRRWAVIVPIVAVALGASLYGGRVALLSWKAQEKAQIEAQIRKDLEQQRLLEALAADAGPTAAPDAGSSPVAAADGGIRPVAPVAASGPAAPSGPVAPTGSVEPVAGHPRHDKDEHPIASHDFTPASCPDGMRSVRAGSFRMGTPSSDDLGNFGDRSERRVSVHSYCIDAYEYPNHADSRPMVGASFSGAEAACSSQGKRLCSEEEWEKACKGPDNLRFPYGQSYSSQACNGGGKGGVGASGSYAACKSGYGVYDMSGNAAEWTSTRFASGVGDRTVKGGSYARSDTDLRCSARQNKSPSSHAGDLGFRCCVDLK